MHYKKKGEELKCRVRARFEDGELVN